MEDSPQETLGMASNGQDMTLPLVDASRVGAGIVPMLLLTLATIWLLGWLGRRADRLLLRVGLVAQRNVHRVIGVVQWALGLAMLAWTLRTLLAPLSAPAFAMTIAFAGMLALLGTGVLSDLIGGLSALFRFSLRPGDQVTVGDLSGEVRRVHLTRIQLRTVLGNETYVPGRRLLKDLVEVSPLRRAYPVTVRLSEGGSMQEGELVQLRDRLFLLPYRVPDSPLRVVRDQAALVITCHVWQQQALPHVEKAVRAAYQGVIVGSGEDEDA